MKKLFWIFSILLLTLRLPAQTNEAVKLALISETDEASAASDILNAQLSGNQKIHLLERDAIEKVYHEQGMSAANRDDLKLGRILGADGLLLLDVVRTPQATNLTARLITVKPGVILTDGSFPWPLKDTAQWAESVSTYLNSFLPKLSLLVKDAIPISVVNLRSAISSDEGLEAEKQLKLLTIQRLSQERQLFVLERKKMQLLGEEKELNSDESAFWEGSYLLDGVIDQNGYSKDTITINARLTPPKGGVPIDFEVSGSRTNLSEAVNSLAIKVIESLKISSTIKEWNAADEATQYFKEAKWALRWGMYSEAEAAANSAWALGKKDLDCALVRVQSYVSELSAKVGGYQNGSSGVSAGYNAEGVPLGPTPPDSKAQSIIKELLAEHPFGIAYQITKSPGNLDVRYVTANGPPDARNLDRAMHALELYYEFSRNSSEDDLIKVASEGSGWKNSDWYNLGIEDLVAASQVLQNFNFSPESQETMIDKLAELRALARSVARWISESSSVHDSYFVGDRVAVYDELANTIGEDGGRNPNIFSCEVKWGCFWQETPEDCVAFYRELMSSPVFCYVHNKFWFRELQSPRLIAWNAEDQKRIPTVWNGFVQELNNSTNILLRLEVKALQLAEADSEAKMGAAFTNFFNAIFENNDVLVANNVDVLYLSWGAGDLVEQMQGETSDALRHLYYSDYRLKLEAMDQEYRDKTVTAQRTLAAFEMQKQYLKENKPYDFFEFVKTFEEKNYSKAQALEIQPLIASYKSNLVAQSQNAAGMQKGQLMGAIAQVDFLENDVNRILNPPPPPQPKVQAPQSTVAKTVAIEPTVTNAPEIVTNVINVSKFFAIPLDGLQGDQISNIRITAHHWLEGKLLLDFQYNAFVYSFDENGAWKSTSQPTFPVVAIFDPATEHWEIISCPEVGFSKQSPFYHRSALLHGELFNCDGGQIKKYDSMSKQWRVLTVSDGNNYELFAISGHLYAANQNTIFEIVNDGKETRILASTRRQPPASALDTENLGTPTLFEGPNHSLRVCTSSKLFTWTGNDWREDSNAPPHESGWRADGTPHASSNPEIFMDGVLFRQAGFLSAGYQNGVIFRRENGTYGTLDSQDEISCLANETNLAKLYLKGDQGDWRNFSRPDTKAAQVPKPFWKMPANLLPDLPAALRQSDLYLLEDDFAVHTIINERHEILQEKVIANDTYNAALLCFSRDLPLPQKLFLKFEPSNANTPTWMFPTTNLMFFGSSRGVWIVPISQLDSAIAMQKQTQLEQKVRADAEEATVTEKAQKAFLSKYDLNHNGIIDPDEREAALDGPAFIEHELDVIDANHNGWLDAEELVYFDANKNKILEAKEQSGIVIAQHLLAERLLKKFDADGDGRLDRSEFNNLSQSSFAAKGPATPATPLSHSFSAPDDNHDGYVDLIELENYLKEQTRRSLRAHGASAAALLSQNGNGVNLSGNPQQLFKAIVEFYWQQHK